MCPLGTTQPLLRGGDCVIKKKEDNVAIAINKESKLFNITTDVRYHHVKLAWD